MRPRASPPPAACSPRCAPADRKTRHGSRFAPPGGRDYGWDGPRPSPSDAPESPVFPGGRREMTKTTLLLACLALAAGTALAQDAVQETVPQAAPSPAPCPHLDAASGLSWTHL